MRILLYVVVVVMIQGSVRSVATAEDRPDTVSSPTSPICFSSLCLNRGMPQAQVLEKLAGSFQFVHLNESQALDPDSSTSEQSYVVKDKLDSGKTVGVVTFVDRRLSWASSTWGYADGEKATVLAATVYSLIEHLTSERGTVASVETNHSVQGSLSVDQIMIIFGGKEALITILKQKKANGDWATGEVHVDEAMREPEPAP